LWHEFGLLNDKNKLQDLINEINEGTDINFQLKHDNEIRHQNLEVCEEDALDIFVGTNDNAKLFLKIAKTSVSELVESTEKFNTNYIEASSQSIHSRYFRKKREAPRLTLATELKGSKLPRKKT